MRHLLRYLPPPRATSRQIVHCDAMNEFIAPDQVIWLRVRKIIRRDDSEE
ncbi:hypothetical protein [Erwinia mallotivora]|nr:hypothetical protein [Erwinia mallotivora]